MASTEIDLRELRDLILNLDKKNETQFAEVKGELKRINERIGSVEQRLEDTRLFLLKQIGDTRSSLEKQIGDTRSSLEKQIGDTRSSLEKQIGDTRSFLETRIDDTNKRIDDINKRIDDVNARLNTFSLGFLGIVGILVTGMLTMVGKLVFFPGNP